MTITVSVSATAYLQGSVAEYAGVALAGSLHTIAAAHGNESKIVDTGATASVGAGELVFAALVAEANPGTITPGTSQGIRYTRHAQTSNGSDYEEDITSSAAGPQHGTATFTNAVEWSAVCAVFHPYPTTPPVPPSTPGGLASTSVASTRVALSWSPSTGSVAGYTVYRDGTAIGTTGPDSTIFLDPDVLPATIHTYTVDAFDLANDHSARSAPLTVATPSQSVEFVQGAADSPASRLKSDTLTLSRPVLAGDLLVGWFSQYNVSGQVHVSDNVNGAWTRSVSTTWGGAGDIALYYKENSAAALSGLTITLSANSSAYLQEAVAHYRHVATVGALDQAVVSTGVGSYASTGPAAAIPAGELVVAAVLTAGQPAWATPGSSQRVPFVLDVQNGSASSDLEDVLSAADGAQQGSLTLGRATNWYMVLATFFPPTTANPTTTTTTLTTTTTRPPTTTTSTTTTSTTTTLATTSTTTTTRPPTTTTLATTTTTTTTTTRVPTTSTTTTTTSTTLLPLPCSGLFPVCLGSCPAGRVCTADHLLGLCVCR